MRCPICGRPEHYPGNRMTHFVHDHMDDLDATSVRGQAIIDRPAPWRVHRWIELRLREQWDRYPTDPHNLDNRTPERLELPVL